MNVDHNADFPEPALKFMPEISYIAPMKLHADFTRNIFLVSERFVGCYLS